MLSREIVCTRDRDVTLLRQVGLESGTFQYDKSGEIQRVPLNGRKNKWTWESSLKTCTVEEMAFSFGFSFDESGKIYFNYWNRRGTSYEVKPAKVYRNKAGYSFIRVASYKTIKICFVHRLVWAMHFGPIPFDFEIDHLNSDPTDNRIQNLRAVHRNHHREITRERRFLKKANPEALAKWLSSQTGRNFQVKEK